MAEKDEEYQFLITRAKYHQRMLEEEKLHSQKIRKTKYLSKFLTCANHKNPDKDCPHCVLFPVQDRLPNARLPTGLQVLGHFFYLNALPDDNIGNKNVIPNVAADVMNHWISCNVYTITKRSVINELEKLVTNYNNLKKVPLKKKGPTYATNLDNFSKVCTELFDIRCTDPVRLSEQEATWNVTESQREREFYDGQCKTQVRVDDFDNYHIF